MQRTIRLKLHPSDIQAVALEGTTKLFTGAYNLGIDIAWQTGITNHIKLHYAAFRSIRDAFPDLVCDLACEARKKAAETARSAKGYEKAGHKVSKPNSKRCPPRFNHHTLKVDWGEKTVRMSTVSGRQMIAFSLPEYVKKFIHGKVTTTDLILKKSGWWLNVSVKLDAPICEPTSGAIGIDLGIVHPAVSDRAQFFGKRAWVAVDRRLFELRRKLEAAGTKSARKHLRKLSGRQRRFRLDCDHVVSKQIVATVEPGGSIVIENLTGIRKPKKRKGALHQKKKLNKRMHNWSFAQLSSFIRYKAEDRGCTVVLVSPEHTSQTCSRCGFISQNNRPSRSVFSCGQCGYRLNADLNAAKNILAKYRAAIGIPSGGGLPVNQPIVSKPLVLGTSCLTAMS